MDEIDINKLFDYLPHRYPFLLVDRVLDVVPGESLKALKNVSINEPFFQGHFPKRPVMPGVLIIEALAQSTGVLIYKTKGCMPDHETDIFFLASVEKARFKRIVEPGDQMILDVKLLRHKSDIWKFNCVATVDGDVACTVQFTAARGTYK